MVLCIPCWFCTVPACLVCARFFCLDPAQSPSLLPSQTTYILLLYLPAPACVTPEQLTEHTPAPTYHCLPAIPAYTTHLTYHCEGWITVSRLLNMFGYAAHFALLPALPRSIAIWLRYANTTVA